MLDPESESTDSGVEARRFPRATDIVESDK